MCEIVRLTNLLATNIPILTHDGSTSSCSATNFDLYYKGSVFTSVRVLVLMADIHCLGPNDNIDLEALCCRFVGIRSQQSQNCFQLCGINHIICRY